MATDLKDIRETVKADRDAWFETQQEANTDMLCVSGKVWEAMDPEGLRIRQDRKRPALNLDELGQFTNQLINEVRANKRAIRVTPIGYGANDKTATYRQNRIRQIEYRSNAQSAYTPMFENAVQRSYGYLRITAQYVNDRPNPDKLTAADFEQELLIKPIVNPNTVIPDAAGVMSDGSDMQHITVTETLRKAEFERKYPDADPVNFEEGIALAPGWIKDESVTVGEHWCVESKPKTLLLVDFGDGQPQGVMSDVYAKLKAHGQTGTVKRERAVQFPSVKQYLTNGLEILDTVDWPGKYLPFVQCLGKVIYLNDGGQTKRVILSLPRLARDPAMLYCYVRTCVAEAIGGVPRATVVGYEGQFAGFDAEWQKANHEPVAYLQAKAVTDATGNQVLPLPQRQSWDPPIQNLEIAAESARRAIQSAIGSMPLPTQAQRQNEKSGVALQRITETTQKGQFHFIDHFEEAIARTGVILEDLLPYYDDTAKDVTVRRPDNETEMIRINDPNDPESVPVNEDGQGVGLHDVTISTGPSKDSEREAASDFASGLIQNQALPQIVGPQKMSKIIALGIKLLDVGPVGDEIANVIDPPPAENGQPDPAQTQQMMQQAHAVIQAGQQHIQSLEQQIATEQVKQQATIQKAQIDSDKEIRLQEMRDATSIAVAKINALAKGVIVDAEAQNEALATGQEQAHELAMSAHDHTLQMATQQAQQQHAQEMAQQGHQQALEQGQQQADNAAAQQQTQIQAQQAATTANQMQPTEGSNTGVQ